MADAGKPTVPPATNEVDANIDTPLMANHLVRFKIRGRGMKNRPKFRWQVFVNKGGPATLRIDDDANPEFWMEIDMDACSVVDLARQMELLSDAEDGSGSGYESMEEE